MSQPEAFAATLGRLLADPASPIRSKRRLAMRLHEIAPHRTAESWRRQVQMWTRKDQPVEPGEDSRRLVALAMERSRDVFGVPPRKPTKAELREEVARLRTEVDRLQAVLRERGPDS